MTTICAWARVSVSPKFRRWRVRKNRCAGRAARPAEIQGQKRYADRLRDARNKTGDRDAVQVALGTIQGRKSVIAVQDFQFMGGSLGMAAGEAVVTAGQTALENNAPLIMVAAAGGARMQEGILSLMQMPAPPSSSSNYASAACLTLWC